MKTSVIEVHDMLSVLSVDELEKRIGEVPGVGSATVNSAAGNVTVRFDETRLEVNDIKSAVRLKGYEAAAPADAAAGEPHEGHTAPDPPPTATGAAAPGGGTAEPGKPAPSTTAKPAATEAAPPPKSAEMKSAPAAPDEPAAAPDEPAAPPADEQEDKGVSDKH